MIGVDPSGTTWPPTTGVDGGLYDVIKNLQDTILPIGMMVAWVRPSEAVPIPTGFALCDGTTLGAASHDFTGGGNVTLPDMRNRFILGADQSITIGQAGVAITDPEIDGAAGAPGPSGTGGSNTATLSAAQLPTHSHSGSAWTGWSPIELMWYKDSDDLGYPKAGNFETAKLPTKGGQPCHGVGGWKEGQHQHLLDNLSVEGSGIVHENRPAYVGLIWIMKVKNIG